MPMRSHHTMESDSRARRGGNDEDRISQLPDPLLLHILSLTAKDGRTSLVSTRADLPPTTTRDMVRSTSMVSRRWKNLWASVPVLFFKHDEICGSEVAGEVAEGKQFNGKGSFERFVNAVLLLRDLSDVHKFQIRWHSESEDLSLQLVTTWIKYAVRHNVKSLDIYIFLNERDFTLPHCIFRCPYLKKMRLEFNCGKVDISPPKNMWLGQLRKLRLDHIMADRDSLQRFLSGCPVLEELQLYLCLLIDPDICSNVLKRLNIDYCEIKGTVIRISIPSLLYLCFTVNDVDRLQVRLENLSSLVTASFQTDDFSGDNHMEAIPETIKFVETVPGKELFGHEVFHNLKKLELSAENMSKNFQAVAHFLRRSPNLEKLILSHDPLTDQRWESRWMFDCPHLYMEIQIQCGNQNDNLIELLTEELLSASKCDCLEE